MTFLKSLFPRKTKNAHFSLPIDFDKQVKKAISLLETSKTSIEDKEVLDLFVSNDIAYNEAVELLLFLPIAFARCWLTTVKWRDTYIDYVDKKKKVERKYSETESYMVIWNVTDDYFKNSPNRDTILKIGGRSSEFHAINKLLIDESNLKIEEIELSQTVIIRG